MATMTLKTQILRQQLAWKPCARQRGKSRKMRSGDRAGKEQALVHGTNQQQRKSSNLLHDHTHRTVIVTFRMRT
jgi:hypothetical protein